MKRFILAVISVLCFGAPAFAAQDEDISIRGNFPQILARGETTAEMAQRIAVLIANLDRKIAPPCGMKRIFEFAGADYYDANDLTHKIDPSRRGVWRLVIAAKGCWATRVHNVFLFSRVGTKADLRLGVPGRSVAGVKHQADATQLVLREANGIAMRGNCEDPAFLTDTAPTVARQPGKPWTEVWSASACEVTRKFAVMFTPEGDKMRIAVALND